MSTRTVDAARQHLEDAAAQLRSAFAALQNASDDLEPDGHLVAAAAIARAEVYGALRRIDRIAKHLPRAGG